MIGIALNVHHLRDRILRLVAQCVNDDAATHRAIGTRAPRLAGSRDLQILGLSVDGGEVKSECGNACTAKDGALDECPAGEVHKTSTNYRARFDSLRTPIV